MSEAMRQEAVLTGTAFSHQEWSRLGIGPGETDQQVIGRGIGHACDPDAVAQPEGVFHDLRLLLDPVFLEWPTRPERVVVARPRHAARDQKPFPARLDLPDMHEFMDEQSLPQHMRGGEIVAIRFAAWMKMQVPARRHGDPARLEGEPFAPADPHAVVIDRMPENAARKGYLSRCQAAFAASGA